MAAGKYDRRVTPQQLVRTKDPVYKSTVESWVDLPERWAEVKESATAGEATTPGSQATYARPHVVKMYWCDDVTPACRLRLDDGSILQILGTAMVGRKVELMLTCTEWKHQQP